MSTYSATYLRQTQAADKMAQGQAEAADRQAEHEAMIRRNKEANAARDAERAADQLAEWREQADAYDPAEHRQHVVDAGERLRQAVQETPAFAALVDLLTAMQTEVMEGQRYRDTADLAGIPAKERKRSAEAMRDHAGRPSALDEAPLRLLLEAIGHGRDA